MSTFPFRPATLPNFREYLVAEATLQPDEINTINQFWDGQNSKQAELEGGKLYEESLRKSSVIPIWPNANTAWIFERMTHKIFEANGYYHFDLSGFFEPLQLAEYVEGNFFDWHLDFGAGESSNRKLSLTIQLSDPDTYEGGDLEFQINNKIVKAPRSKGTAIIFPSFIMHRVTKITKGSRRSIVAWIAGPPYK